MKPTIPTICTILLGGIVSIGSTASLVIDITSTQNIVGIVIDLIVMFISYMTVWNAISSHIEAKIARKQMEIEWDYKVKPLTNILMETITKVNKLELEIMNTNLKINTTLDYVMKTQDMDASKVYIVPGASFKFICKVMVIIIFSFYSLFYTTSYPLSFIHYYITGIYVVWWILFTSEYKLFKSDKAWIWGITPILIVPALSMILDATIGLNYMIGVLFFGLIIYAYSYYVWSCFKSTGYKLIDPEPIIYILKEKLIKRKK